MGASPFVPASVYMILANKFDQQTVSVQEDRQAIAKKFRKLYEGGHVGSDADFNDDDLDCYEELVVLGLAKRCDRCKKGYTAWSKDEHGKGKCEE